MVTPFAILALSFSAWTSGVAPVEAGGSDAFAKAAIVPPSADLYLRAVDGAALRRELSSRPMGAAIAATILDDAMLGAWRTLARDVRCDERELFDRLFGRDVTLAVRWSGGNLGGGAAVDWALVSAVDVDEMDRLFAPGGRDAAGGRSGARGLGAALGISILGGGWREFARQQVAAWYHDGTLVVAPSGDRRLGEEIVAMLGAVGGPRLGNDEALVEARALGGQGPRIEIFSRPMRGAPDDTSWTAAVAELRGGVVELRRRSSISASVDPTAAPLSRAIAMLAREDGLVGSNGERVPKGDVLDRLRDGGVVAFVEPLDDRGDASDAVIAMAPDLFGAHGDELRLLRALADGPTTVVVASRPVGEAGPVASKSTDPAANTVAPTALVEPKTTSVALVTEIRNPMNAESLQEHGLRQRDAASIETMMSSAARAGGFPVAETGNASPLFMQIITTERGRWKVVCNDPAMLGRVVNELRAPAGEPTESVPATSKVVARRGSTVCGIGVLDGRGLAGQMRRLHGSPFGLAAGASDRLDHARVERPTDDGALPAEGSASAAVAAVGDWVAEWAAAIDTLRWVLSQPQPDRIDLRATIELVGPAVADKR